MKYFFVLCALVIMAFAGVQPIYAAAGELGDSCRPLPNQCDTGLECNGGICTTPCGGPGQQCCQTTDLSRLCDVEYDVSFKNLRCTNVASPSAGICQEVSCGDLNNACCTSGPACKSPGACNNSVCIAPIATNSATLTLTPSPIASSSDSGKIIVPIDPNAKDFFEPSFTSIAIQSAFFVLTIALILSVIGKDI
jgi:hypothetical protein